MTGLLPSRPGDGVLTVDAVAERLQVHPKTVLRYVHDGRLRATRIGKAYRILAADLDAFVGLVVPPRPTPTARVTTVVELSGLTPGLARKWASSVANALHGGPADRALHAEVVHDPERATSKIVIAGELDDVRRLLGLVAIWVDQLVE